MKHLPVLQPTPVRVESVRPDPRILGEGLWRLGERAFLALDRLVARGLPAAWSPLAQTGAIANTTFLIAAISGVVLLVWYSPSVHLAHASLEAMRASPLTAQLARSLHRYSSDGCMLFVILHALRLTFERRFTGARWLAWVTGILLLGLLWVVGWLGYWLVWDEPARQVALGTAKLLDGLPIFADPLSRSFLTDGSINSLLFFMVFFFHMLIPLGMGIALWLHITRLNRPHFLAGKWMTVWIVVSLVGLSLLMPATSGDPARMAVDPGRFAMDAWYLLPLLLTDRLGGGVLWGLVLVAGVVLLSAPWWVARRRAPVAEVDIAKCNGCRVCHADCPYDAITMVPRTDGRGFASQAVVDASKCVGCGICAGSCDSAGIGLPLVSAVDARARMDGWIDEMLAGGERPRIAFLCASAAGGGLVVDAASGRAAALPGYRVMPVACLGWVHMLTVERALRHGAADVLLGGCADTSCTYREGGRWTAERLEGMRAPALRPDKAEPGRVHLVPLDRTQGAALVRAAAVIARAERPASAMGRPAGRGRQLASGAALIVACALVVGAGSKLGYSAPSADGAELVVSFKHPGKAGEHCRKATAEENARLPVHMRRDEICERGRASVRLRVTVDDAVVVDRRYAPRGLSGDGNSIAIEHVPVSAGPHRIAVAIGETADPAEWTFRDERAPTFDARRRRVVLFDRLSGFSWHGDGSSAPGSGADR